MLSTTGYSSYLSTGIASLGKYLSSALAAIIYNMDTFNVDENNLRVIDNVGGTGYASDAPMYASDHIFLDGSTQSVDYPIPHTLGSEEFPNGDFSDGITGWSVSARGTLTNLAGVGNLENTDSTGVIYIAYSFNVTSGNTYKFDLSCLDNQGRDLTVFYGSSFGTTTDGGSLLARTSTNDIDYEFEITPTYTGTMYFTLYFYDSVLGDVFTVDNWTMKRLTNPNSYLTYFDTATKSHVTVDNSISPSTTYTQEDSHSNTFTTTVVLTDTDLSLINLKPESIARLVDGETVAELSFDLTDIEAFYPGNEGEVSGAYVQDAMVDLGILNADVASWTTNTSGIGNTNTNVDNVFTIHNEVTTLEATSPYCSADMDNNTKTYIHKATVNISSGTAFLSYFGVGSVNITINDTLPVGTYEYTIVTKPRASNTMLTVFNGQTETIFDATLTIETREATVAEIINYASTCRTNLDLTNYGASNLLYKQDATGRWLGMADAGTIVGASDGRNIDIQMTIPYNHLVTKDIDKIEGTLDSCTITYVDTTTEIVP